MARRSASHPGWIRVLGLTIVLAAVAALAHTAMSRNTETQAGVDQALDDVFLERGVDRARLSARQEESPEQSAPVSAIDVAMPAGDTYARLNADVKRAVEAAGGSVLDAVERGPLPERPESLEIELGRAGERTHKVTVRPEPGIPKEEDRRAPRVAVVFDDLGYSVEGMAAELLEIRGPLTFAVLPGLARSESFAERARQRGHDVILHLPMEPLDSERHDPGANSLDPALDLEENRRRLRLQLDAFPDYSGVSNHMGSRATTEAALMDLLLEELRTRDRSLFVLDSRTTPYSVLTDRARRVGVRCAANNVFLDANDEDGTVPEVQVDRVASIARRYGHAIAIGHVRRDTVDAVKLALEEWQRDGIQLVPLSDLMHR